MAVHPHSALEVEPLRAAGGGGQPDLLVWGLLVDDIGAVCPQVKGQHATLSMTGHIGKAVLLFNL